MVSRTLWSPTYPAQHENPAWSVIKTWLIITPSNRACNSSPKALVQDAVFAFSANPVIAVPDRTRVLDYQARPGGWEACLRSVVALFWGIGQPEGCFCFERARYLVTTSCSSHAVQMENQS